MTPTHSSLHFITTFTHSPSRPWRRTATAPRSTSSRWCSSGTLQSASPTSCRGSRGTSSTATQRPPLGWSSRRRWWRSTARRSRRRSGTLRARSASELSLPLTTEAPLELSSSTISAEEAPSTAASAGSKSSLVSTFCFLFWNLKFKMPDFVFVDAFFSPKRFPKQHYYTSDIQVIEIMLHDPPNIEKLDNFVSKCLFFLRNVDVQVYVCFSLEILFISIR